MAKQHHTKDKGDLGVFKAQCSCVEQGYTILLPLTEHASYDFVPADFGQHVSLRVDAPKNNQAKLVHFADDYLEVP